MHSSTLSRRLNIFYALLQATFWAAFLIPITFAGVYLTSLGFSNTELGLILALGNVGSFIVGSFLAARIDRVESFTVFSTVPWVFFFNFNALLMLIIFGRKNLLTAAIFITNIVFTLLVNSLNTKLCVDLNHMGYHVNFGISRGIGSLGYVLLSLIVGNLVEVTSFRSLPWAQLAMLVLQAVVYFFISRSLPSAQNNKCYSASSSEASSTSLFGFFLKYPRFFFLIFGAMLVFAAHNTTTNFMINVTENVGGSAKTMGYLSAYMAVVEIPMMFLFHRFQKKFSLSSLMRFAFIVFIIKNFAIAFAGSVPALCAAFTLQGLSFAIFTPGIVPYADETIPFEDSAKAQAFGANVPFIGSVLCSVVAGYLYDSLSVRTVLMIAAGFTILGSLLAILGIEKARKRVDNV